MGVYKAPIKYTTNYNYYTLKNTPKSFPLGVFLTEYCCFATIT